MPFCQSYLEKTDIIITNLSEGLVCNLRHSSAGRGMTDGPGRWQELPLPLALTHTALGYRSLQAAEDKVREQQCHCPAMRENYHCQKHLPARKGWSVTSQELLSAPEVVASKGLSEAGFIPLEGSEY